jgi:hypothetical protein
MIPWVCWRTSRLLCVLCASACNWEEFDAEAQSTWARVKRKAFYKEMAACEFVQGVPPLVPSFAAESHAIFNAYG